MLEKSDDLQRQSRENLNATTGGDSFAYMLYTPWGVSPFLKQNGKYPLHDLSVQILAWDTNTGVHTPLIEYKTGALGVGQMLQLFAINLNLPDNDHWEIMTYFNALNGHWAQETHVRKVGGEWYEQLTVRRDDNDGRLADIYTFTDPRLSNK